MTPYPIIAILCAAVAVSACSAKDADSLAIASYNIRHGAGMATDEVDLGRAEKAIKALAPDLIALQEIDNRCARSGGVDQAAELGKRLGMHHAFGKFMDFEGGGYGLAALSRYPIAETHVHRLPDGAEPRCALEIVVEIPDFGKCSFVSIHNDWTDDAIREKQVAALLKALADRAHPVILAGDFNAGRGEASMKPFAAAPWTNLPKEGPAKTWPADNPKVEIDHLIVRGFEGLNETACQVVAEKAASDHRPVAASLPLSKPTPTP